MAFFKLLLKKGLDTQHKTLPGRKKKTGEQIQALRSQLDTFNQYGN